MIKLIFGLALSVAALAEMKTDVEFARPGGTPLTLDAWVPEGKGPFATVIVVHGGGFTRGDKQTFVPPLFPPLTKGGFTWFTINYRLAPQHQFPAAVEDVESAIRWVKAHAKEYKVDRKRIAIMGESAGGHLVSFAGAKFTPDTRVAAVVSFYGPHDLASRARSTKAISEGLRGFLGVSELNDAAWEKLRVASPMSYVKKDMPPYLLIHGTKDELVPHEQSVEMCAKMKSAGALCELFTVPGAPHGIGGWEKNPEFQAYKEKMVQWLKSTLKVKP